MMSVLNAIIIELVNTDRFPIASSIVYHIPISFTLKSKKSVLIEQN